MAIGEGHIASVTAVALGPKGATFVVTGGADQLLKVWELKEPDALAPGPRKLRTTAAVSAHDKDINTVAVSPNGALLCTGSQDRTAKLWRTADLAPVATLKGHKRGVWQVRARGTVRDEG